MLPLVPLPDPAYELTLVLGPPHVSLEISADVVHVDAVREFQTLTSHGRISRCIFKHSLAKIDAVHTIQHGAW
jgi:hypothetical protein